MGAIIRSDCDKATAYMWATIVDNNIDDLKSDYEHLEGCIDDHTILVHISNLKLMREELDVIIKEIEATND